MRVFVPVTAVLLTLLATEAAAQSARHAVHLELGGSAVVPSINYERRFGPNWFGRAGLSFVSSETTEDTEITFVVPLTVSHVGNPDGSHHLELGGGITLAAGDRQDLFETVDDDETFSTVILTGIAGYRYQKPSGGFQFRAVFTPLVGEGEIHPWAGLSFGYAW